MFYIFKFFKIAALNKKNLYLFNAIMFFFIITFFYI